MRLRDVGWVWEGQGLDPQVPPSIYGLGQGAEYFGLTRVNYLFQPNDEHAMKLLSHLDEVTCDISKWDYEWTSDGAVKCVVRGDPAAVRAEGEKVARLSTRFSNITGAFYDDVMGLMKSYDYGPEEFGEIRAAIRDINPELKLWAVVYTHEFEHVDYWRAISPHIDVVNLWVWESSKLADLDDYVDQCRKLFAGKPIIMGVYLRDYGIPAAVPVSRVLREMEDVARLIERGKITGYSILGSVLIDGHREQADAVRDFIAGN